ncbi:MAG: ribokinase [Candidatus Rokubacteria bacterium]|nr:ribokinase [Candidatus Rokubacteria bacterium]
MTIDRFGDARRLGGAALYAAITAQRLGLSVGLLTSHGDDFPLEAVPPAIEVVTIPAAETTTFVHGTDGASRTLSAEVTANPITAQDLPDDWADAPVALLAPVANEVDPLIAARFPDALIGAAVQGWLRQAGDDGIVTPATWAPPSWLLDRVAVFFMSLDDVQGLEDEVTEWLERLPLAVLTAGAKGALLYVSGDRYEIAPLPVEEIDATGAGDVFAAAFLTRLHLADEPWEAARVAACAAAMSVCGPGFTAVPNARAVASALGDYRRMRDAAP